MNEPKARTTFVTVLCILSFIGIGLGIISNTFSLVMPQPDPSELEEAQAQIQDMSDEMGEDSPFGGLMENLFSAGSAAMEHAKTLALVGLVGEVLCLVGVLRMWNMRKSGFVPYLIGEWGPGIISIVLIGLMGGLALAGFFIPAVMTLLYGLNLKDMH